MMRSRVASSLNFFMSAPANARFLPLSFIELRGLLLEAELALRVNRVVITKLEFFDCFSCLVGVF